MDTLKSVRLSFERLSKLNELVVELRDSMALQEAIVLRDTDVAAPEILLISAMLRLGAVVRLHAIHREVSILVRRNRASQKCTSCLTRYRYLRGSGPWPMHYLETCARDTQLIFGVVHAKYKANSVHILSFAPFFLQTVLELNEMSCI